MSRVYVPDIDTDALAPNRRLVQVFAPGYTDDGMVSKTLQQSSYSIGVVVVEKYGQPGTPTNAWMDSLVAWVKTNVADVLGNARVRLDGSAYADSAVIEVFDQDEFVSRKVFWSTVMFTFKDVQ